MTTPTICAIATPKGQGGIGVVRLSGSKAYAIGLQLTQKQSLRPRYAHFSPIYSTCGEVIDEALVLYFNAPHSFTGEDVLEIQGHGGMVLPELILRRCLELGAVLAGAGEFSYRAFTNDKIDLLQAESIADAIAAVSEIQARSAMRSLSGVFSQKIRRFLQDLIQIRLYVEAMIDFSDEEDVDFLTNGALLDRMDALIAQLMDILAQAKQGALIKEGVQVVLAGPPNAGKSSLLNHLAGHERAIVTDVAGTTRDTLQETLLLNGLTCHITDTAGLHQTADKVEQIGIERAKSAITLSDVVLFLYDLDATANPWVLANELLPKNVMEKVLLVGNKVDLTALPAGRTNKLPWAVNVSCTTGVGMKALVQMLCEKVGFYPSDGAVIARARHVDALGRTLDFVQEAKMQLLVYRAGELAAESLKLAQNALAEVTGEFSSDELLGRIFGQFCIGK